MPLNDDFLLTQITIDTVNGPRSRAKLIMDPDDVRGRGLDVTFLNVQQPVDMSGAVVNLWWQHDQAPALRGLDAFTDVDAATGHWKIYWPPSMGESAGTVTAKIMVGEDEHAPSIPLPKIQILADKADPSAAPSEDTFSVLAELLRDYKDGAAEIAEWTEHAKEATQNANDAADRVDEVIGGVEQAKEDASQAVDEANQALSDAQSAVESANAAAQNANDAADEIRSSFEENEAERQSTFEAAEERRQADEDARQLAETERETSEQARADAETQREEWYAATKESVEAGEFDGATFTPSVDDEGNLSWTNDQDKENPETKNIRGPKGEKGDQGEGLSLRDSYDSLEALQAAHPDDNQIGDAYMAGNQYYTWNGSEWKDCGELQGAKGDPGPEGPSGKDGISVTHEWDGTTLKVTSASGTSEADLQGPPGENATTTELASVEAPGLMAALSGNESDVWLGNGTWGEYHGGGASGPIWLEVDENGDLYAYYDDVTSPPALEYDDETGNLYALFETE